MSTPSKLTVIELIEILKKLNQDGIIELTDSSALRYTMFENNKWTHEYIMYLCE